MDFQVITLFPDVIQNYFNFSIMKRAVENNVLSLETVNPRDFAHDKHKRVDDAPYGGGNGMVLMCEPFFEAYESIQKCENSKTILLTPQGAPFTHQKSLELSKFDQLILICGHYEGFDERIRTGIELEEISVGDFVLTGGELPSLCVIDAVSRHIGALGKDESAEKDSFSDGLLEYPQYTRPASFRGVEVPEVLTSGNHKNIEIWRRTQQILRTKAKRPDLYEKFLKTELSKIDKKILAEIEREKE